MSIYRATAFIDSFQYSLMKPPSDTWLQARSLDAQQHRVLLDTTPNIIQFNAIQFIIIIIIIITIIIIWKI